MSTPPTPKRDTSSWAKPVDRLQVGDLPAGAINLNVQDRQLTGPLHGFGQLWQKNYRIRVDDVALEPTAVIKTWKANFATFWPAGNRFYGKQGAISAGDVAVLNLAGPARAPISTGILVIYADDVSFSFMTPKGHVIAGMNTFSAHAEERATVLQVEVLMRASDPIYEIGCRIGMGHKMEDSFWHGMLQNLAAHIGSQQRTVEQKNLCLDPRVQWSQAKNIWYNAAIRTALNTPVRWLHRLLNGDRLLGG